MKRSGERGSATLEMAVLAPAMLLIVALIIAGGRIALAKQTVSSAAGHAARAASLARTIPEARTAAQAELDATMKNRGMHCQSSRLDLDLSGFNAPLGESARVNVSVSCTTNLSDLVLPGLQGHHVISSQASSPLDSYRERR